MKLIDTNVILRYMLNDVEEQSRIARDVISNGAFTIPEVIAEVVYVLATIYKESRENIAMSLDILLYDIDVGDKKVVRAAIKHYALTKLDYVDCLLVARHEVYGDEVVTFDRKLNNALQATGS
jgi:predicted nucleic-acid-binding protein